MPLILYFTNVFTSYKDHSSPSFITVVDIAKFYRCNNQHLVCFLDRLDNVQCVITSQTHISIIVSLFLFGVRLVAIDLRTSALLATARRSRSGTKFHGTPRRHGRLLFLFKGRNTSQKKV